MQAPNKEPKVAFRPYCPADREQCLALFDANCPAFFAANERVDFEAYLHGMPSGYSLCVRNDSVVGAFGVAAGNEAGRSRLNWIMLDPSCHGQGLGSTIMTKVLKMAAEAGSSVIDIAASQYSADFFAHFGASETQRTKNGWGPGMDRIDMELHPLTKVRT